MKKREWWEIRIELRRQGKRVEVYATIPAGGDLAQAVMLYGEVVRLTQEHGKVVDKSNVS